jgi:hypothetical protein
MDRNEIARRLDENRETIVERVVTAMLRNSFWVQRYGAAIQERLRTDIGVNLQTMSKAIRYRSPMIFDDHMRWRRNLVLDLGTSTGRIRETLLLQWQAISELLPSEILPLVMPYVQSAVDSLSYDNPAAQQIVAAHELLVEDLLSATFDAQWQWQAAYETTGRSQAQSDAWYVIDFLIDSVGHFRPDPLVGHVMKVMKQEPSSGLSSTHYQQQLWLLAQAAERRITPEYVGEPTRILMTAAAALAPEDDASRALAAAQDSIIQDVTNQIIARGLSATPAQTATDIGWMLAYLRDSIAQNDPHQFVAYTQLMQRHAGNEGQTFLYQSYQALDNALATYLPAQVAYSARTILRAVPL